jgi:hypothetical protein
MRQCLVSEVACEGWFTEPLSRGASSRLTRIKNVASVIFRSIAVAGLLMSTLTVSAEAAQRLSYAQCRARVIQSPVYLGGKESSLACMQPCEAAIARCMENGGKFD